MKRIANNVAVATLLFTMKPDASVKICDIPQNVWLSGFAFCDGKEPDWHLYTVNEILHNLDNTRIAYAKILHTCINDGDLMLVIDTDQ